MIKDLKSSETYRLVKRLHLLASQRIDELLKEHNLARSQFQVLYLLSEAGELAGKDLLVRLQVEPATLSGIVDTLEQKGWLKRLADPGDRRAKILKLTSSGRKLIESVPSPAANVERQMLASLEPVDKRKLEELLGKMIKNLERN